MNLLYYSSNYKTLSPINPEHVLNVFVDLEYEVLYAKTKSHVNMFIGLYNSYTMPTRGCIRNTRGNI